VTHFFDLISFLTSPAATRWAALFYEVSLRGLIAFPPYRTNLFFRFHIRNAAAQLCIEGIF